MPSPKYRYWRDGAKWMLRLPDDRLRVFTSRKDLMDYISVREKRLVAIDGRRAALIVREVNR